MAQQLDVERIRALLPFRFRPRLVVQMPLTFDVRVLERIRPATNLARAGLGNGFEI
jgi:hypothetical protein